MKVPRLALRSMLPPIQLAQRDFPPVVERPWLETDHSTLLSHVSQWHRVFLSTVIILSLFVFLSQTHIYVHTYTHNGAELV